MYIKYIKRYGYVSQIMMEGQKKSFSWLALVLDCYSLIHTCLLSFCVTTFLIRKQCTYLNSGKVFYATNYVMGEF